MLVLSRRKDERIYITTADGQRIIVNVCEVSSGQVKLGIDASGDVAIIREELLEQPKPAEAACEVQS